MSSYSLGSCLSVFLACFESSYMHVLYQILKLQSVPKDVNCVCKHHVPLCFFLSSFGSSTYVCLNLICFFVFNQSDNN